MDTGTDMITGIHLGLIAVLAIVALAAIVWGMRLKRRRAAAAQRVDESEADTRDTTTREQAELGRDPAEEAAAQGGTRIQVQTQVQTRTAEPAPVPVAPPPAPIADEPAPVPVPVAPPEPNPLADEPVAAAAAMTAGPAAEAEPAGAASAADPAAHPADRAVTTLKGLGPKVAAALAVRGITSVGQLAALGAGEADALDADLGPFRGRMARDRWIEQARFLAAGDVKGFEAVFGRL